MTRKGKMNTDLISILLIAFGLSADCFAVALSGGISNRKQSWLKIFRVALAFGFFQALMPALGWLAGRTVIDLISGFDHWIAFGLLGFVGGRMIWESFHHSDEKKKDADISKGWLLLTLAIATSIDALAVGLSLAFVNISIALACPVIGAVAFGMTVLGFMVGRKAGALMGKRAEAIGGIILIAIAIRILLSHLM
jgi:manganese efflux pump family protein